MIRFIAEHKDHQVPGPDGEGGLRWGVEPMCAVLSEHGVPISASTYYEWITKTPTRRQLRDGELIEIITAQREDRNDQRKEDGERDPRRARWVGHAEVWRGSRDGSGILAIAHGTYAHSSISVRSAGTYPAAAVGLSLRLR